VSHHLPPVQSSQRTPIGRYATIFFTSINDPPSSTNNTKIEYNVTKKYNPDDHRSVYPIDSIENRSVTSKKKYLVSTDPNSCRHEILSSGCRCFIPLPFILCLFNRLYQLIFSYLQPLLHSQYQQFQSFEMCDLCMTVPFLLFLILDIVPIQRATLTFGILFPVRLSCWWGGLRIRTSE